MIKSQAKKTKAMATITDIRSYLESQMFHCYQGKPPSFSPTDIVCLSPTVEKNSGIWFEIGKGLVDGKADQEYLKIHGNNMSHGFFKCDDCHISTNEASAGFTVAHGTIQSFAPKTVVMLRLWDNHPSIQIDNYRVAKKTYLNQFAIDSPKKIGLTRK